MSELTHFSLFSGIGGIDLAAEWAGFTSVGQCEFADYPTKVLEKHWPDVPRWRDIRDVTLESVRSRGIRTIDLISGGFPCQPFSVAGDQKGKEDPRYLWPEMLRATGELTPSWVVGENVPGILRIAADDVCKDLEREGYEVGIFNFEAAAVRARHRRERVFFVANSRQQPKRATSCELDCQCEDCRKKKFRATSRDGLANSCQDVSHTNDSRLQVTRPQSRIKTLSEKLGTQLSSWWDVEPDVGRVANGVPNELHGGGINEQNGSTKSSTKSGSDHGEMRDVWSNGGEIEPAPLRLLRLYGRENSLYEMPCKGSCKISGYCNLCDLWQNLRGKRPQEKSKDMQPGMPCGVWEAMRYEAMESQWRAEPNIPRVATGIKNRVDRLKCLGNAVVPQQVYPILKAIADIERKGDK